MPSQYFLENDGCNYFEGCQQTQQTFFFVTNFLNLFFAIIFHIKSRLLDKIIAIFENTYHEN